MVVIRQIHFKRRRRRKTYLVCVHSHTPPVSLYALREHPPFSVSAACFRLSLRSPDEDQPSPIQTTRHCLGGGGGGEGREREREREREGEGEKGEQKEGEIERKENKNQGKESWDGTNSLTSKQSSLREHVQIDSMTRGAEPLTTNSC